MTPAAIVDALLALDPLTELPRTGWRLRGVVPCESIAEHCFGVAVLTGMLIDVLRERGMTIDGEQALRMALLHDAAEAKTGDVPMPSKTPELQKALKEQERRIVRDMLPARMAEDVEEAEHGDSLEARIVKAADKLQMMVKLHRYELTGRGALDEFWLNPKNVRTQGLDGIAEIYEEVFRRAGRSVPS
ncbi:MAG: HD family hydrolase [Deltaproteobacteria bacterium]|nr:HD family hydrolase [Deltaproteobacteria bacterium]